MHGASCFKDCYFYVCALSFTPAVLTLDLGTSCPAQFKVFPTVGTPKPTDQLIIKPLMRWDKHVEGWENLGYVTQQWQEEQWLRLLFVKRLNVKMDSDVQKPTTRLSWATHIFKCSYSFILFVVLELKSSSTYSRDSCDLENICKAFSNTGWSVSWCWLQSAVLLEDLKTVCWLIGLSNGAAAPRSLYRLISGDATQSEESREQNSSFSEWTGNFFPPL